MKIDARIKQNAEARAKIAILSELQWGLRNFLQITRQQAILNTWAMRNPSKQEQ
jgi:hypothetical protein